jgi:o-succinylbenzoate synthase
MQIEPFSVRLDSPLETARGTVSNRDGFLVRIDRDDTEGIGEATPLPGWTESKSECRDALERAERLASELDWGVGLAKLDAPAARHGLSLALLDAAATQQTLPVYRSLAGDRIAERVPVNATLGSRLSPEATANAVREAVDDGYTCVKVKAGTRDVEEDVERIRAVRNAVGDDVSIRVDANGAWTREQAASAIESLAALAVEYVEQPLPTAELEATGSLVDQGVDIALDESLAAHDVETILDAGAADVLVLKPMVLGGPDLAYEAAMRCREAGVEPIVSTTIDAVVARTAAVHVAASIPDVRPCGLATGDRLATDLAPDPASISEGAIRVPQDPGLGVDVGF